MHQSENGDPDPHQSEKRDTDPHRIQIHIKEKSRIGHRDPHQSEEKDPDLHPGAGDPQHCCYVHCTNVHCNFVKGVYLCSREGRFTAVHIGMFAVVTLRSCTAVILSI
jgi:hypothetical protein